MGSQSVGFGTRLGLALKVLFDGAFAFKLTESARQVTDDAGKRAPEQLKAPEPAAAPEALAKVDYAPGALHMLALLQREGRLVDFLHEDISGFSDADVGAAARVVHEGCGKVLAQYVILEPIRNETEGGPITVDVGFDAREFRLTGDVKGEPPYLGVLAHPGWRAMEVKLPQVQPDHEPKIVAPAEVEL